VNAPGAGAPDGGAGRDQRDQERLAQLAEEQAALRRVATLVARGEPPEAVFAAVAEEVGQLFRVELVTLVRYEPGRMAAPVTTWGPAAENLPVGIRWPLEGHNINTLVFETGRPARIDRYGDTSSGRFSAAPREGGIRSAVGTPVIVEGRLWGVIFAGSTLERPLPPNAETRLASFTELVATAIANTESRASLARLAQEQAALRRVATLVARGAAPEEVFTAVAGEVGQLLPVDQAALCRYEPDGMLAFVSQWGGVTARVDYSAKGSSGPIGVGIREAGLRSAIGTPIIVEGRLWGTISVASQREQPLPTDTEARLVSFTELVATAIANTESRASLARLAQEQAALRRVATLVARGAAPDELFAAVTGEVGHLLGAHLAGMGRYDSDDTVTVLTAWGAEGEEHPLVPGPWPLDGGDLASIVFRTGQSVRIDDYHDVAGPIAVFVREELGVGASVASPIVVEGRLWGVLFLHAKQARGPFPRDAESRLTGFTELVATAIANAESRLELAASRRRIVTAADEARRRIERDLHDGTQQRLVSLGLAARTAETDVTAGRDDLRGELSRIAAGLADAVTELQEFSRGIHPAALSERGLGPALRTLARRSAVPVDLEVSTSARCPEPVETAAYYVASEALANAMKHARATRVEISLAVRDGSLLLSVRDDGVGGADPARGSGLAGLADRVEALGGSIQVRSAVGAGTHITVDLPLEYALAQGAS
jgi:signal transduction histidine kinase